MNLAEATRILRTRDGDMHQHAAAATFVSSYYAHEGRSKLRPVGTRTADNNVGDIAATCDTINQLLDRTERRRMKTRDQESTPGEEYRGSLRRRQRDDLAARGTFAQGALIVRSNDVAEQYGGDRRRLSPHQR